MTDTSELVLLQHRLAQWEKELEKRTLSFMTRDEIQLIIDKLYRDLRAARKRAVEETS